MEKGTTQGYLWLCLFKYPQFHRKTRDDEHGMKCLRIQHLDSADNLHPGMLAFKGLLLCGLVHWNARMTEMKRSGIEVLLAFADNVRKFTVVYY